MFRFTIRDLLWLTVVVALGVGWWVDRRVQSARMTGLTDYVEVIEDECARLRRGGRQSETQFGGRVL